MRRSAKQADPASLAALEGRCLHLQRASLSRQRGVRRLYRGSSEGKLIRCLETFNFPFVNGLWVIISRGLYRSSFIMTYASVSPDWAITA